LGKNSYLIYVAKVGMLQNEPIVLLEEHFFAAFLVYKKSYEFEFEDLSHEVLQLRTQILNIT
jgi:hypothetical protein